MVNRHPWNSAYPIWLLVIASSFLFSTGCGGSGSSGGGGGPQGAAPSAPGGLAATAGNQQVSLTWNASSGATSYNVKRATTSGGPYTQVANATSTNETDASLTNGTTYYYVVSAVNAAGESANSSQVSGTPGAMPPVPTGLTATAGNQQVSLSWNASAGATSYNVKRSTTSGSGYTQVANTTGTNDTDASLTNGTTYYYVVSAVNAAGESANSSQASATPAGTGAGIQATISVLSDRHTISPYVYGGSYPASAAAITDSGLSVVRWGGNATSTYNWKLGTNNADFDWYFEDFNYSEIGDSDSVKYINDVKAAGSAPLMTMVMLPWVAQSAETSAQQGGTNNFHWSFSVAKYGSQCGSDPYNNDAGNGVMSDCATNITGNDPNDAYFPLLDDHTQTCPSGTTCEYRSDWAAALAAAFGSGTCSIPYSSITSCHFYNMDNEIDIWGGTHRDIHPSPSGYDELSSTYLTEARNLKGWDPQAVRLGPVSCCWWFYWNGANNNDKGAHAGIDFLPWWLNEVYWQDQVAGARSLDMFDIHAYPDGPDTSSYTQAQKQALAVSIYRDYWDPTYVSPSGTINQQYTTYIQPNKTVPFRIPRMRAVVNSIYPDTPLAMTEWSAAFAGEQDFSTALGDADAYGLLGRERVSLASRWVAPVAANPNYQALKLFTNYDGAHHGFGTTSVSETHNADPDLFSTYAALNSTGTTLTILVLNKDPGNAASVQFTTTGFGPSTFTSYSLSQSSPTAIVASSSKPWSASQTFAPYTATLLVISGTLTSTPSLEWDLNPDTTMVPASGTVTLYPTITKGLGNVTLSSAVFDGFEGSTACTGGTITLTTPTITNTANGEITVNAGSAPGFCHFTVTGSDGTATQTQGGWIVVGNPAATLANTSGNNQTGTHGTTLAQPLKVTLSAGQSGGSASGASILFTATAGSLSNGTTSGAKVVAVTNSSGVASVTLTLPSTAEVVTVTAEGPYGLGHPVAASFTETSQ
jgi:Glycoside hydrolase family 44